VAWCTNSPPALRKVFQINFSLLLLADIILQMDWFENWFGSPYYSILYQNRDELEAQEFVESLLDYLQPPAGSTMLDIACGEGRYAHQLAGHGYRVTGIDLSECSIAVAKQSETDNLEFFVHDMRLPFITNYFDYAFNFFTSFGYFSHDRDNELAAKAFAGALRPGGILVIDYLNRDYVIPRIPRWIRDAEVERKIQR